VHKIDLGYSLSSIERKLFSSKPLSLRYMLYFCVYTLEMHNQPRHRPNTFLHTFIKRPDISSYHPFPRDFTLYGVSSTTHPSVFLSRSINNIHSQSTFTSSQPSSNPTSSSSSLSSQRARGGFFEQGRKVKTRTTDLAKNLYSEDLRAPQGRFGGLAYPLPTQKYPRTRTQNGFHSFRQHARHRHTLRNPTVNLPL